MIRHTVSRWGVKVTRRGAPQLWRDLDGRPVTFPTRSEARELRKWLRQRGWIAEVWRVKEVYVGSPEAAKSAA